MIRHLVSTMGTKLGNWNDDVFGQDTIDDSPLIWRILDDIASRLYVLGDGK